MRLITSDFQVYGLRRTLGRRAGSHTPLTMSRTLHTCTGQIKQQKGTKVTVSCTQQLPTTWHHFQSWWCPFLSIQSWIPESLVLETPLWQNVYVINFEFWSEKCVSSTCLYLLFPKLFYPFSNFCYILLFFSRRLFKPIISLWHLHQWDPTINLFWLKYILVCHD